MATNTHRNSPDISAHLVVSREYYLVSLELIGAVNMADRFQLKALPVDFDL